jgi:hypothetical protein
LFIPWLLYDDGSQREGNRVGAKLWNEVILNVQYGIIGAWVSKSINGSEIVVYTYAEAGQATLEQSSQILWQRRSFRRRQRPTTAVGLLEVDQPGDILAGCIPRIPSCASLLTSTTATRMALFVPVSFLCICKVAPLSIVPQHRRSFVFKFLVKELSIRSIIIRWRYPFPWYDAWESYPYAGSTIYPAWCCATCEFFAEVRGKVVAVFGEKVVGCSLEFYSSLPQVRVNLCTTQQRHTS